MFGLFAAKCPLATERKLWVEQRMNWLAEMFGIQRMLDAPDVVPEPELFPEAYSGSAEYVAAMFRRVCQLMELDPGRFDWLDPALQAERVRLQHHTTVDALGFSHIRTPDSSSTETPWHEIDDPVTLVATISRSLAQAMLLGEHHLTWHVPDHQRVADLATVYFGMGVFCANTVVREHAETSSGWYFWKISTSGHLSELEFAYALALFAWVRGEAKPGWARYLRPNVSEPFYQSLRYLMKTQDSWFRPDAQVPVGRETAGYALNELLDDLGNRFAGVRLAAVRELGRRNLKTGDNLQPVLNLLHDTDEAVRRESAALLGRLGPAAQDAIPLLVGMAADRQSQTRSLALRTLGEIGLHAEQLVPQIASLLEDDATEVRMQAALTLGDFGESAFGAVPALNRLLEGMREDKVIGPAYALGQIGLTAFSAVGNLMRILYEGEGAARVTATRSLAGVGHKSEATLAALQWATADDDHEVRHAALEALADLAPLYEDSIPALKRAAGHEDPGTRLRAAVALAKIDGQAGVAVECLADSMFPPLSPPSQDVARFDEPTYVFACAAFAEMGTVAVGSLLDLLSRPHAANRTFAAWALGRVGNAAAEAVPALRALLANKDPTLRLLAAMSMWNVCREPNEAVPALIGVLRECNLAGEVSGALDLCRVGPVAAGASTAFLDQLDVRDDLFRAVIRLALREIGAPAVESVAGILRDQTPELGHEAAMALAAIDYTVGGGVIGHESAKLDHDLAARKLLSLARKRRTELDEQTRRFQLATLSLEELATADRPSAGSTSNEICEATWLLIAALAK